jgi:hypothetical protein
MGEALKTGVKQIGPTGGSIKNLVRNWVVAATSKTKISVCSSNSFAL